MSQDAHSHDTHATEKKHKAPLSQAFWFTLLLASLFIAAVNFVNVMGNQEEEGHEAKTEAVHETQAAMPAGEAVPQETHEAAPAADTAHTEAAH